MRGVGAIGGTVFPRWRGVSVRGSDQDSVTANLRALRRQRLGVVDVIAADEAVVDDDNR